MDMFTPSPPPNNFWMPPVAAPADEHVRELVPSPVWAPKHEGKVKPEKVAKSYADMVKKNKFEEVVKDGWRHSNGERGVCIIRSGG